MPPKVEAVVPQMGGFGEGGVPEVATALPKPSRGAFDFLPSDPSWGQRYQKPAGRGTGSWFGQSFDTAQNAINPLAWFGVDPVRTASGGVGGVKGIFQAGSNIMLIMMMLMMTNRR